MTITQNNWLDFPNLIINEFVGGTGLFLVLGLVLIVYFSVKYRLGVVPTMAMTFIFIGLVISNARNDLVWMLVLFVAGIAIYGLFAKVIKR